MEADEERIRLEKLAEELVTREDDESQDYLMQVSIIFIYDFTREKLEFVSSDIRLSIVVDLLLE